MTDPIKSDQSQHASSPYLNAYIQKQRLAQASRDASTASGSEHGNRRSQGAARVYETRQLNHAPGRHQNGESYPAGRDSFAGSAEGHPTGKIQREDRPIDRLHQFEIERGLPEDYQEGDENPYDDSSDDTPDRSMKAAPRTDTP